MATILITGGSGYIGSVLCSFLLKDGHYVRVLDNFRHGVPSLSLYASQPNFEIVRGDARLIYDLTDCLNGVDVVIPLAGLVGVTECDNDPQAAVSTNTEAIKSLCQLINPEQRVVYPNTNSGYGQSGEPICVEESPLTPISLYGKTKVEAEVAVRSTENHTVFRLATAFGMSLRMRWTSLMVNNFCWRAVKDHSIVVFEGQYRRNFIHVRDVARAFCWAIDNPDITNRQVFNLGLSDANLTKLELAKTVATMVGDCQVLEAPLAKDPDQRNYFVSNYKIEQAGFKPMYSLHHGIIELIKGVNQWD